MQSKDVIKRVYELTSPIAENLDVDIWDIEFEKEGGQYMLTVFIDRKDGVEIEHCEKISRELDPLLDDKEFSSMPSYTLCVSSAGLERKLKKKEHFEKFLGARVEVKFYKAIDGIKTIEGDLLAYDDGGITIKSDEGEKVFERSDIAYVRTVVVF